MIHGLDTDFLVAAVTLEHDRHFYALELIDAVLNGGDKFALAPQVLCEFVHVATDGKRFQNPHSMRDAIQYSRQWWTSSETVQYFPTEDAVSKFHEWIMKHRLGRKRLLDTMLAATYYTQGVTSLLTINQSDFIIFDEFTFVSV